MCLRFLPRHAAWSTCLLIRIWSLWEAAPRVQRQSPDEQRVHSQAACQRSSEWYSSIEDWRVWTWKKSVWSGKRSHCKVHHRPNLTHIGSVPMGTCVSFIPFPFLYFGDIQSPKNEGKAAAITDASHQLLDNQEYKQTDIQAMPQFIIGTLFIIRRTQKAWLNWSLPELHKQEDLSIKPLGPAVSPKQIQCGLWLFIQPWICCVFALGPCAGYEVENRIGKFCRIMTVQ